MTDDRYESDQDDYITELRVENARLVAEVAELERQKVEYQRIIGGVEDEADIAVSVSALREHAVVNENARLRELLAGIGLEVEYKPDGILKWRCIPQTKVRVANEDGRIYIQ